MVAEISEVYFRPKYQGIQDSFALVISFGAQN